MDSLGLNEQELSFLSHVTNGPHMEAYPVQAGTVHVHKVGILYLFEYFYYLTLGSRNAALDSKDLRETKRTKFGPPETRISTAKNPLSLPDLSYYGMIFHIFKNLKFWVDIKFVTKKNIF